MRRALLLTGATGLVGARVLRALRADDRVNRVYVAMRRPIAFHNTLHDDRIVPIRADVRAPMLGLDRDLARRIVREVSTVVHCAADTSFAQTLDAARAINTEGTRNLLELTESNASLLFVYVSTAFVAGSRTGLIRESDPASTDLFINAYEQSKAEAERLVRSIRPSAVIARSSTIVCDDVTGHVTQQNAIHRALRLYFSGMAAMLPACDDTTIDCVTTTYAAHAIARLALDERATGATVHLCAGRGALHIDELLDVAHDVFSRSPRWMRRGIARPVRTDLETYRLFEQAVNETGRERVKQAVRSLGHFVPQLAYPKQFDTTRADALLGAPAPEMRDYWPRVVASIANDDATATPDAAAMEVA